MSQNLQWYRPCYLEGNLHNIVSQPSPLPSKETYWEGSSVGSRDTVTQVNRTRPTIHIHHYYHVGPRTFELYRVG
jgi:hypothetical protein